ncbi:MAG TPA: ABC transporter ATP-binding protein [Pseudoflavonifractor sp.]|nr:ABC transporter ATP-binding protein [Pseudoflavonifractor sp.]
MRKLARYLKQFKGQVLLGPAFKLAEAILELLVPLVMASIVDVGIRGADEGHVWRMGVILAVLAVLGCSSAMVAQYAASRASQGFGTLVRSDLFRHIASLSHAELDSLGTASLITRLNSDINQLQVAVAMFIRLVFRAPFLAVGATVMAMLLDLRLSLIFLAAAVLIALALWLVMSRSVPYFKRIQRLLDKLSLITQENLEGARVIRAFSKQESERSRFDTAGEELRRSTLRVNRLSALLNPATSILANAAILAILWFGGRRVYAGTLTQGQVIALWNYMTQILLALIVVANLVVIFTKAAASAQRVNEVFETYPSVTDTGNTLISPVPGAPKLRFEGVSFRYPGGGVSLAELFLDVAPGETIGIIGGTGAGKSTLVNLVPRFYDATEGRVLVDGVDVKEYPFPALRGQIGMVPQAAVLFSGTIRSNLRWRKADGVEDELWAALELAQAADFVRALPEGLDSPVAQGGKNFSGGQRQRLTIARALVGSPSILILDDSASALDFATDAALRRALKRDTAGMTVLMVSQRANTVKGADRIVVLDGGAVAGIGAHAELFESCPVYREICLSQLSEEEAKRA